MVTRFAKCECLRCRGHFEIPCDYIGYEHECPHCHEDTLVVEATTVPPAIQSPCQPRPPAMLDGEQCFFNEGGIAVTKTRFVVGSQTYAMAGITSICASSVPPAPGGPVAVIGSGCFFILLGIVVAIAGAPAAGAVPAIAGILLVPFGLSYLRSQKTTVTVVLTTAAGEIRAYSSVDEQFVRRLIDSLGRAIIARG